ncbi:MAG: hypothetical protein AAB347_06195 [Bacteroidota bacterium]
MKLSAVGTTAKLTTDSQSTSNRATRPGGSQHTEVNIYPLLPEISKEIIQFRHPSYFILIFVFNKSHLAVLPMETATYSTTLVKTYRRLFSCLMFYN